jgi:hypothetical protein
MKSAGFMAHVESAESTVSKESPDVSASVPIPVATHIHEAYEKPQDLISTQGHGMIPQPQFMAMLNQGHLIRLLKYHLHWLAEDDITDHEVRTAAFPSGIHALLLLKPPKCQLLAIDVPTVLMVSYPPYDSREDGFTRCY